MTPTPRTTPCSNVFSSEDDISNANTLHKRAKNRMIEPLLLRVKKNVRMKGRRLLPPSFGGASASVDSQTLSSP